MWNFKRMVPATDGYYRLRVFAGPASDRAQGHFARGNNADGRYVGQFLYTASHEMGHAVFDLLNVPLFGRPEDDADQFAAYVLIRIGKNDARRLIEGAAYIYRDYVKNPTVTVPV